VPYFGVIKEDRKVFAGYNFYEFRSCKNFSNYFDCIQGSICFIDGFVNVGAPLKF
jgi:hypothetical protein